MTFHLSESLVLQGQINMCAQSIIKKISNYIFRFDDKIGEGNFSKVYKGYHQVTSKLSNNCRLSSINKNNITIISEISQTTITTVQLNLSNSKPEPSQHFKMLLSP